MVVIVPITVRLLEVSEKSLDVVDHSTRYESAFEPADHVRTTADSVVDAVALSEVAGDGAVLVKLGVVNRSFLPFRRVGTSFIYPYISYWYG